MTSALDITRAVNPPRAAFLDFPLGHTAGKPHDPALGREILVAALEAFESLGEPGGVKILPFRWDADDAWKANAMSGAADERTDRSDAPQYQTEDDRHRAESGGGALGTRGASRLSDPMDREILEKGRRFR